jgi:superfamily II DNA/RNA helicase
MTFKKLNPELKESMSHQGILEALPFQEELFPKIKSGSNCFIVAPEGSGKTTALVLYTLNKLNFSAFDDAPRALIVVKDKDAAIHLEEEFKRFMKGSDLRIYAAYEEIKIEIQREAIYVGVDIVIATPKRLHKIYFQNGINLKLLQLFIIEDADFLIHSRFTSEIVRLSYSISKCQYLIFSTKMHPKIAVFKNQFMENALTITK